jgi:hypothetical protein
MSKREREDEEGDDRPAKRSRSVLQTFLDRHSACYAKDRRLDNHAFTMSRLLHYDPDKQWGLFYTFDLVSGRGSYEWWRSHYALGTRLIGFGQDHHPQCTGWAGPRDKPQSVLGRVLSECACPLKPFTRMQEWRVSPSGIRVVVGDEEIWRGKPVM